MVLIRERKQQWGRDAEVGGAAKLLGHESDTPADSAAGGSGK